MSTKGWVVPFLCGVLVLFGTVAGAEEWTPIESADEVIAIEYSKESVREVSANVKRARSRFVSKSGGKLPRVGASSVVSEVEYNCLQPLEKLLSSQLVLLSGAALPPQLVDPAVYNELPHGSNSYRLWMEICSRASAK